MTECQCTGNQVTVTEQVIVDKVSEVTLDRISEEVTVTECQHSDGLTSVAWGWHSTVAHLPQL